MGVILFCNPRLRRPRLCPIANAGYIFEIFAINRKVSLAKLVDHFRFRSAVGASVPLVQHILVNLAVRACVAPLRRCLLMFNGVNGSHLLLGALGGVGGSGGLGWVGTRIGKKRKKVFLCAVVCATDVWV